MVNYYDNYDFITNFASTGGSALAYQAMSGYDEKYVADVPSLSARGMLTGTTTRVLGDTTMLVRSLYYDHHGNVIQTHETNALGGTDHTYSHLTFTGKPLQVMQIHSTADTTMTDVYSYTYDNMERLLTASVSHDGGTAVQLAQNNYNQLGQLYRQYLGIGIDGITYYSYNVRGWTTGINNTNFRQTLHYQDAFGNATPCYNGNISAMEWRELDAMMASTPTQHHYCYTYDGMNRLTEADYGTAGGSSWNGNLVITGGNAVRDYDCTYQYDLNGNITALTRKGVSVALKPFDWTAWTYGTIDDLSLTYDGNRLKKVEDQCADLTYEGAMDFRDGVDRATEYIYDANGNLTSDRNKGITAIAYNVLNLPSRVEFDDGHIIRYRYAADGRKLRTEYVLSNYTVIDNPVGPLIPLSGGSQPMGGGAFTPGGDGLPDPENQLETTLMVRDYCSNHIYRDGVLERVTNDYGYWADGQWHYHIKDYQGNVRAVIDGQGALEEVNNYYPYGGLMGGGTVGSTQGVQPYKYGTKELDRQNGLDWYDSQARMYDPLLGRTPTMDPKAEDYAPISPYAWCAGNPIGYIDPNGKSTKVVHSGKNTYTVIGGNLNDKDRNIYVYTKNRNGDYTVKISGGITDTTEEANPMEEASLDVSYKDGKDYVPEKKSFFHEYWWVVLAGFIVIVIVILLIIFAVIKKRKGLVVVDDKVVLADRVDEQIHLHINKVQVGTAVNQGFPVSLIIKSGGKMIKEINAKVDGSLIVGRAEICDLYIDDPHMSKQHFAIEFSNNMLMIMDLESKNGTFLNGVRLNGKRRLSQNDVIQAGSLEIIIRW